MKKRNKEQDLIVLSPSSTEELIKTHITGNTQFAQILAGLGCLTEEQLNEAKQSIATQALEHPEQYEGKTITLTKEELKNIAKKFGINIPKKINAQNINDQKRLLD